jgi:hypothetical protein
MMSLPKLTPLLVSRLVSFDRKNLEWTYRAGESSIANLQAEGVAGIWNILVDQGLALLADEVGMGKTIQALSVVSHFWRLKPNARILVIAPNQSVAENWANEYTCFLQDHYKQSDNVVKCDIEGAPIHAAQVCSSLEEVVQAFAEGVSQFVITKVTIFSYLGDRASQAGTRQKAHLAQERAKELRARLLDATGTPLDLMIVDEAHYLRNVGGTSQRVAAARTFFGVPGRDQPLSDRTLLMTATPNHTTNEDVRNLLSYFLRDVPETSAKALQEHAIRRLRLLDGRTKYQYREEIDQTCSFGEDSLAEVFFALYQKQLAELEEDGIPLYTNEKRRFLYGYLEGFETAQVGQASSEEENAQERSDYRRATDTEILRELSGQFQDVFGKSPRHPKYDQSMETLVPSSDSFWKRNARLPEEDKTLVFVRRIPSCRELAARVNEEYDRILLGKLMESLGGSLDGTDEMLRSTSLRQSLDQHIRAKISNTEDQLQEEKEAAAAVVDEGDSSGGFRPSKLMDYFRKGSPSDVPYSQGFLFRARFQRAKELFPLFFEPPWDPERPALPSPGVQADYPRWVQQARLARWEAAQERSSEAQILRAHWDLPKTRSVPSADRNEGGLPTLASIFHAHLRVEDQAGWERFKQEGPIAQEAFFQTFLRKGLLLASGAIVELYGWFLRAQLAKNSTGSVYARFCEQVDRGFSGSLTQSLVSQAMASFRETCEKIAGLYGDRDILRHNWNELNAHDPGAFCSGEVADRQRLIRSFNTPFFPNVLVATSVLQEGVNLHHHCRRVLHYGIAWTPGDNEQRVGRVDRLFGAVHRNIVRGVDDRLLIRYPYLQGSFDEDQVGQFIVRKYAAEKVLDRGETISTNKAVDVSRSESDWRSYLRKPEGAQEIQAQDPYPFRSSETVDPFWTKHEASVSGQPDLDGHIQNLVVQAIGECPSLRGARLDATADKFRWLISVEAGESDGSVSVLIDVVREFLPDLASASDHAVFCLKFSSALFRSRPQGLDQVWPGFDQFPLVQLCEDPQGGAGHSHFHARACLPLFATQDALGDCSSQEVAACLDQLVRAVGWVHGVLGDGELGVTVPASSTDSTGLTLDSGWRVQGDIASWSLGIAPPGRLGPLVDQFQHPFLFGAPASGDGVVWELRFPALDFQASEQGLLARWGKFLQGRLLRGDSHRILDQEASVL